MQLKTFFSLTILGLAAAQSTPTVTTPTTSTSGTSGTSGSSVAGLVDELPRCALPCFSQAAKDIGCEASDFTCLCQSTELVAKVGPCIVVGGACSSDDVEKASDVAPQICNAVKSNPDPADLASASGLVTSAMATVSTSPTATGNVAMRTDVAMGAMGVAAAFAVFAL